MSKVELDPVTSGYNLSKINENFQRVEDELNNKVLYRKVEDGEPNHMSETLDMNSNDIINVTKVSATVLEVGGVPVVPSGFVVDPSAIAREALERTYAEIGYPPASGSFEIGGTVNTPNQTMIYSANGVGYSWAGPLPKVVPAGSTPSSTGGVGPGAWIDKSDVVKGPVLNTIAELKLVSKLSVSNAFVAGYYAKGDGGGGSYYYDQSDTTSADNGGTIIVAADGGRWKLIHNGSVSVLQFGARGDGVTNDSPAFSSLASAGGVGHGIISYRPLGYKLNTVVVMTRANFRFVGEWYVKIIQTNGSRCFKLANVFQGVSGVTIYGSAQTTELAPITIGTDVASLTTIHVRDCYGVECYGFIDDGNHATNLANFLDIRNITLEKHRGAGINTSDCWASYFIRNVTIDRVGTVGVEYNHPGFRIQNAEGVFLIDCAHNGSAASSIQSSQDGALFINSGFVVIDNFIPDHCGGYGIRLSTCNGVKVKKSSLPNPVQGGFFATSCGNVSLDDITTTAFVTSAAGGNGFLLQGCTDVRARDLYALNWKQDGWHSEDCDRLVLGDSQFTSNGNRGIVNLNTPGTSVAGIIRHCILTGNVLGNMVIEGSSVYTRDVMLNSGALNSATAPITV